MEDQNFERRRELDIYPSFFKLLAYMLPFILLVVPLTMIIFVAIIGVFALAMLLKTKWVVTKQWNNVIDRYQADEYLMIGWGIFAISTLLFVLFATYQLGHNSV